MIILRCDKCGLEEKKKYWNPKLIKNIDNPEDYHMFWYEMVAGSGSYIDSFPLSKFYIEELGANLCNFCYEKWERYKAEQQHKIKEVYKVFLTDK